MDSKNFSLFMLLVIAMVGLITFNFTGDGWVFEKQGLPEVASPFTDQDYNISVKEDQIRVDLADWVAEEYDGRYLSLYAYDAKGTHISIMKRIVGNTITIEKDESPSFITSLEGNQVTGVIKAKKDRSFYEVLDKAIKEDRSYGLGRCLLGRPCVKICPVAAVKLMMDPSEEGRGRIIPDIDFDKCIGDGKCPTVCPTNLITFEEE